MNPQIHPQPKRRRFAGLLQIVRYNWPQYAGSLVAILAVGAWLHFGSPNLVWLRFIAWGGILLVTWWCLASLLASYWIYDRSELYRWTWIPSFLPAQPRHWLNLHAGLDESSATLRKLYPDKTGQTCDFYDAAEMLEPSIRRARGEHATPTSEHVDFRHFAFPDQTFDTVFLLFSAHELRCALSREVFFHEIRRVLVTTGTVLLVEHIRDLANFVAFGPGYLHFMPGKEWHRLAKIAGLEVVKEHRMTPFVKTILLRKNK